MQVSEDNAGGYGVYVYGATAYNAVSNPAGITEFIRSGACVAAGNTVYFHFGAGYDSGSGLFAVKFEVEAVSTDFWQDFTGTEELA